MVLHVRVKIQKTSYGMNDIGDTREIYCTYDHVHESSVKIQIYAVTCETNA
jgi:hypothetical protein